MNARTHFWAVSLSAAFVATACGEGARSNIKEQLSRTTGAASTGCEGLDTSREMPLTLRLTSITMPAYTYSPAVPVDVYVTLPGQVTVSTHLGAFAPGGASDLSNEFNCTTTDAPLDQNRDCTASLPMVTTVGPTTFTGVLAPTIGSATASVRINDTTTNFSMDRLGNSSSLCASAYMEFNNQLDGDLITVCWAVGVPYVAPPLLEAVYYLAPGERSSVGLSQSNTTSIKTAWTYQSGGSLAVKYSAPKVTLNATIQGSDSFGGSQTITTQSTGGFTQPSSTMFADPNNNVYLVLVGANASLLDLHDGSQPTVDVDLASGFTEQLTFGQVKGLAQSPQDVSTIDIGDQCVITTFVTPAVAQQFVAQDPFSANATLEQTIASNPTRFIAATPAQTTLSHRQQCQPNPCPPSTTVVSSAHGSSTDTTIGQSTGISFSLDFGNVTLGLNDTTTVSVTYTDTNQSTAQISLSTNDLCIEGAVNLYMDKAFGTILPAPELENSCILPVACPNGNQQQLDHGQSLHFGDPPLVSCNGQWSLSFQPDGTLSEFYQAPAANGGAPPPPVVVTTFYPPGAVRATMESSGDFVLYDANDNMLTDTGTAGNDGAFLILDDSGVISIYNRRTNPATGSVGAALPPLWTLWPGG